MSLKRELYVARDGVLFADNIDRAWSIYRDPHASVQNRRIAQGFLIFAFDIKSANELNKNLTILMTDRNAHKAANPEYIPKLAPVHLRLDPHERTPLPTAVAKVAPGNPKLQGLFDRGEMLDVTDADKTYDRVHAVPYYDARRRALERVHIYKGSFYKDGAVFDTATYSSHSKAAYAAFTLNANGELSVFNHPDLMAGIVHSSMNSGSPVIAAGEVVIENGKLLSINTFSGHYQPSLFNIYRALEFFAEKGVDISQAKVHTQSHPRSVGLSFAVERVTVSNSFNEDETYYEMSAKDFVVNVKSKLEVIGNSKDKMIKFAQ